MKFNSLNKIITFCLILFFVTEGCKSKQPMDSGLVDCLLEKIREKEI
jgi:hypothetical protein